MRKLKEVNYYEGEHYARARYDMIVSPSFGKKISKIAGGYDRKYKIKCNII